MSKTKYIEQWLAAALFLLGMCIAVFYILFSVEYVFKKKILTDFEINISLIASVVAASFLYFLKIFNAGKFETERIICFLQNGIRYFLAFIFFYYAFIKICGNMFSTSLATLDTPLYKLSGFELTWRFFGYSPFYTWFIILLQTLCGLLLLFRRTALAGCLLGFGIMLNITVINFTHHIQLKLFSVVYTIMLLYFILLHFDSLVAFVFHKNEKKFNQPASYLIKQNSFSAFLTKIFLLITLITCCYKEWKMKEYFFSESPLIGVWIFITPHTDLFASADKIILDKGNEGTLKIKEQEKTFNYFADETNKEILIPGIEKDTMKLKYSIVTNNRMQLVLNGVVTNLQKQF